MKDFFIFILGKITGHSYICDRCQSLGHNYMTISLLDYIKNKNNNGHYCQWCWNYINLGHYNCKCGSHYTLRSSHQKTMVCNNCYKLIKYNKNFLTIHVENKHG